jgi:hypothetical protein
MKLLMKLLCPACLPLVSSCQETPDHVDGYLLQIRATGWFSKDSVFSHLDQIAGGPAVYERFAKATWSASATKCGGEAIVRISGNARFDTIKGTVTFSRITMFRRVDAEESNQLARLSSHPTLVHMRFC